MSALYTARIVTDFAAAHQLHGYDGPCARLHGHNWKVEVEAECRDLNDIGISIDFKDLKTATRELTEALDHRNLNEIPPFDRENPTAENIAAWLYRELGAKLNDGRVRVRSVTLWETERACVRYSED